MTSTSLAELLDEITLRAWTDLEAGRADVGDAAQALARAAGLLERLSDRLPGLGVGASEQRDRVVTDVVLSCRAAERTAKINRGLVEDRRLDSASSARSRGRLTELLAAASDLVNTMNPPLSPGERWAVCAALMDPICACAGLLREAGPSPASVDLDRSLQQLRWWVSRRPAPGRDVARLDQARPSTVAEHCTASARLQHLVDVVTYKVETSDLAPCDGRVAAAAGLHVAIYAKAITSAIGAGDADARAACDAMTSAWFGLRDALRAAIDERIASDLLPYVAELSHQLTARFGPPFAPAPSGGAATIADTATAYRGLLNRLPGLAHGLATAAARWGIEPNDRVLDPSMPIRWRDHSGIDRYVGIAPTAVPALVAVTIAERALAAAHCSAVIAAHADKTAMRVGNQPHTNLVKAHMDAADAPPLSVDTSPESRWHPIVLAIDPRACRDPAWPMLARTLEHAAHSGWDIRAYLPALARDLPTRQTAVELTYRVLECCELPAAVCVDHGPPPSEVGRPARHDPPSLSVSAATYGRPL